MAIGALDRYGEVAHYSPRGSGPTHHKDHHALPVFLDLVAPADLLFRSIVAGGLISCGLTDQGAAYCWGRNFTGSLGQPPDEVPESNVPVPVVGNHVFHWITARRGHTCGLATDDIVYCWGANPFGQLGIGEYSVGSYEPVPIFGQR